MRHLEAEGFRRLQVEHHLEPRWLLHRQFTRLGALENLVDEDGRTFKIFSEVLTVAHQTAGLHVLTIRTDGRQTLLRRELSDLVSLLDE